MSEIDTIEHFFLGFFYGVPVYQPLEPVNIGSEKKNEQSITPQQKLVIGGGDGEHPALILHDIEYCVANWLLYYFEEEELIAEINKKVEASNTLDIIQYCTWDDETHELFSESCSSGYDPFSDEMTFEDWLVLNIGEFVYISLHKISENIQKWHQIYGKIEDGVNLFMGVLIPPPGYKNVYGFATNPYTEIKEDGISRFSVNDKWPEYHKYTRN